MDCGGHRRHPSSNEGDVHDEVTSSNVNEVRFSTNHVQYDAQAVDQNEEDPFFGLTAPVSPSKSHMFHTVMESEPTEWKSAKSGCIPCGGAQSPNASPVRGHHSYDASINNGIPLGTTLIANGPIVLVPNQQVASEIQGLPQGSLGMSIGASWVDPATGLPLSPARSYVLGPQGAVPVVIQPNAALSTMRSANATAAPQEMNVLMDNLQQEKPKKASPARGRAASPSKATSTTGKSASPKKRSASPTKTAATKRSPSPKKASASAAKPATASPSALRKAYMAATAPSAKSAATKVSASPTKTPSRLQAAASPSKVAAAVKTPARSGSPSATKSKSPSPTKTAVKKATETPSKIPTVKRSTSPAKAAAPKAAAPKTAAAKSTAASPSKTASAAAAPKKARSPSPKKAAAAATKAPEAEKTTKSRSKSPAKSPSKTPSKTASKIPTVQPGLTSEDRVWLQATIQSTVQEALEKDAMVRTRSPSPTRQRVQAVNLDALDRRARELEIQHVRELEQERKLEAAPKTLDSTQALLAQEVKEEVAAAVQSAISATPAAASVKSVSKVPSKAASVQSVSSAKASSVKSDKPISEKAASIKAESVKAASVKSAAPIVEAPVQAAAPVVAATPKETAVSVPLVDTRAEETAAALKAQQEAAARKAAEEAAAVAKQEAEKAAAALAQKEAEEAEAALKQEEALKAEEARLAQEAAALQAQKEAEEAAYKAAIEAAAAKAEAEAAQAAEQAAKEAQEALQKLKEEAVAPVEEKAIAAPIKEFIAPPAVALVSPVKDETPARVSVASSSSSEAVSEDLPAPPELVAMTLEERIRQQKEKLMSERLGVRAEGDLPLEIEAEIEAQKAVVVEAEEQRQAASKDAAVEEARKLLSELQDRVLDSLEDAEDSVPVPAHLAGVESAAGVSLVSLHEDVVETSGARRSQFLSVSEKVVFAVEAKKARASLAASSVAASRRVSQFGYTPAPVEDAAQEEQDSPLNPSEVAPEEFIQGRKSFAGTFVDRMPQDEADTLLAEVEAEADEARAQAAMKPRVTIGGDAFNETRFISPRAGTEDDSSAVPEPVPAAVPEVPSPTDSLSPRPSTPLGTAEEFLAARLKALGIDMDLDLGFTVPPTKTEEETPAAPTQPKVLPTAAAVVEETPAPAPVVEAPAAAPAKSARSSTSKSARQSLFNADGTPSSRPDFVPRLRLSTVHANIPDDLPLATATGKVEVELFELEPLQEGPVDIEELFDFVSRDPLKLQAFSSSLCQTQLVDLVNPDTLEKLLEGDADALAKHHLRIDNLMTVFSRLRDGCEELQDPLFLDNCHKLKTIPASKKVVALAAFALTGEKPTEEALCAATKASETGFGVELMTKVRSEEYTVDESVLKKLTKIMLDTKLDPSKTREKNEPAALWMVWVLLTHALLIARKEREMLKAKVAQVAAEDEEVF